MSDGNAPVTRYRGYGLVIDSAIEIIGAQPISRKKSGQPDICIVYGPAEIGTEALGNGPYRLLGNQLMFTVASVGSFLIIDGATIIVSPAPRASTADIGGLLIATALPALLWMRGMFVLHAAAALIPAADRAIAITGPSGAGKSTILAQLVARGARVVGDDTIAVTRAGGGFRIDGLPADYFRSATPDMPRERISFPKTQQCPQAPLGALVVIDRQRTLIGPKFERLRGAAAFAAVAAAQHRPRVPKLLGRHREAFDICTFLCAVLPIYAWRRLEGVPLLTADDDAALDHFVRAET